MALSGPTQDEIASIKLRILHAWRRQTDAFRGSRTGKPRRAAPCLLPKAGANLSKRSISKSGMICGCAGSASSCSIGAAKGFQGAFSATRGANTIILSIFSPISTISACFYRDVVKKRLRRAACRLRRIRKAALSPPAGWRKARLRMRRMSKPLS